MCKWGKTKTLEINGKPRGIDSCIYEFVKMLNDNGYKTIASCCGHGKAPADIALVDGREIIIARDFDEARKINELFPKKFIWQELLDLKNSSLSSECKSNIF
jgi:hypothetical protein